MLWQATSDSVTLGTQRVVHKHLHWYTRKSNEPRLPSETFYVADEFAARWGGRLPEAARLSSSNATTSSSLPDRTDQLSPPDLWSTPPDLTRRVVLPCTRQEVHKIDVRCGSEAITQPLLLRSTSWAPASVLFTTEHMAILIGVATLDRSATASRVDYRLHRNPVLYRSEPGSGMTHANMIAGQDPTWGCILTLHSSVVCMSGRLAQQDFIADAGVADSLAAPPACVRRLQSLLTHHGYHQAALRQSMRCSELACHKHIVQHSQAIIGRARLQTLPS